MRIIEDIQDEGHGPITPSYLFVHSTANPGATAKNHRDAAADGNWKYVTQYVCDWTGDVYHLMPDDRKAWAVGNGNAYGVNLEICEGKTQDQFEGSWITAIEFCAYYLNKRNWNVQHLMSHNEARLKWGGTNHTDPDPYFKRFGRTWQQFKSAVEQEMTKRKTKVLPVTQVNVQSGTYQVYRAYNPSNGAHLYTGSINDYESLPSQWVREGVAWRSEDNAQIIYALSNPNAGQYHYTRSYAEASMLFNLGWNQEISTFSSVRNGKPIYRLYNPNNGDHFLTPSDTEKDACVKAGWKYEGIGFYCK